MPTAPLSVLAYALPALAVVFGVAAIAATVATKFGPFFRVRDALFGVREDDPSSPGAFGPLVATTAATAAATGAAGIVGIGTAIGVGGTGAIAWTLVFGALAIPLRVAEVWLARTSSVGAPEGARPGSLAGRERGRRVAPYALVAFAAVAATSLAFLAVEAFVALADPAGQAPQAGSWGLAVAGAAVALALLPMRLLMPVMGIVAAIAWTVVVVVAITAATHDVGLAAGVLPRAFADALQGAPDVGAFTGALASECAYAAIQFVLLPLVLPTGVTSALEGHARARLTTRIALGSGFAVALATVTVALVGTACVATGAFHTPRPGSVGVADVTFRTGAFETPAGRLDESSLYSGSLRVRRGAIVPMNTPPQVATDRAMIAEPSFDYWGGPADILLEVASGRVVSAMRYQGGVLAPIDPAGLAALRVAGETPPRGAGIVRRAIEAGAGSSSLMAFLVCLGALTAAGVAALGVGLSKAAADIWASLPNAATALVRAVPACAGVLAVFAGGVLGVVVLAGALAAMAMMAFVVSRLGELRF